MEEVSVARLKLGSVYKYGYFALLALFLPLSIIFGLIGLSGGTAVYQNGQPIYGIPALLTALMLGFFVPAVFALWLLLGTAILRMFRRRAPVLRTRPN